MSQHNLRYSDFADRINVEAFEDAIGFVPNDQVGDNDVGFCMFPENHMHGDTTGKFAIEREKKLYNCWSCGGGTLLSLTMELHPEWDAEEATEWLYQFADADLRDDKEFVEEFLAAFEDVERRVKTLPYFNIKVLDRYFQESNTAWFDGRGIAPWVSQMFRLGYSSMVRKASPGKGKFVDDPDYYGPAIILPHFWNERLVGWQHRWLDDDRPEWVKKYTNTPDFPKEDTLFGWDRAKTQSGPVLVSESVPTTLFVISEGVSAVSTFGSGVNDPQLRLLRQFSGGVILAPDNDKAGHKWADTIHEYLKRFIPVYQLPPVPGEKSDLGDLALVDDPHGALMLQFDMMYEPGVDW